MQIAGVPHGKLTLTLKKARSNRSPLLILRQVLSRIQFRALAGNHPSRLGESVYY